MLKRFFKLSALMVISILITLSLSACSANKIINRYDPEYTGNLKEVTLKFLFPGTKNLQVDDVLNKISLAAKSKLMSIWNSNGH